MRYGYARSADQGLLDRAVMRLSEDGCGETLTDLGSDVFLGELLAKAEPGDSVVVTGLAMLAPDVDGVVSAAARIGAAGASLVSIDDGIDTSQDPAFFSHMQALKSVQAASRSQAVRRGMAAAEGRGRKAGRPKADSAAVEEALAMKESGDFTVQEIVDATGVSRATLYRRAGGRGKAPDT